MTYAAWIRENRNSARFTQAGLAFRVGVDERSVKAWEAGEHRPRAALLVKLSEVFRCEPPKLRLLTSRESDVIDLLRCGERCPAVGPEGNQCQGDAGHLGKPFPVGGSHYHGGMCWVDDDELVSAQAAEVSDDG